MNPPPISYAFFFQVDEQFYRFLLNFLELHSGFKAEENKSRPIFFTGESHAGHYIPSMMAYILARNQDVVAHGKVRSTTTFMCLYAHPPRKLPRGWMYLCVRKTVKIEKSSWKNLDLERALIVPSFFSFLLHSCRGISSRNHGTRFVFLLLVFACVLFNALASPVAQGGMVLDVQGMMIGNGWVDPVSQVCAST